MASLSRLISYSSGIYCSKDGLNPRKHPLQILSFSNGRLFINQKKGIGLGYTKVSLPEKGSNIKCESYTGRNHQNLNFDYKELNEGPFWVYLTKKALWAVKSIAQFLFEQPSQLKYIEWPSFQSTLKTATLTLVLVLLLIVALASVDSGLSFLLAVLLRRTA